MSNKLIKFLREKDFELVDEIGQGGFGKTVLLKDPLINENFVCKKYKPFYEEYASEYYNNFVEEIKLLFLMYNMNIVRVFNYYLYPNHNTGYIIMEYIDGFNIGDYIAENPEDINDIFTQTINGFKYLEDITVLHRDIRPQNIMVNKDGIVKIIDFGFGKKINMEEDFDKSIELNWWCEVPEDFEDEIYNFKTEVYFIGKLFEKLLNENQIENFMYLDILRKMIIKNPEERINSFNEINNIILNEKFEVIDFDTKETHLYRNFSYYLKESITKIEKDTTYFEDPDLIIRKLRKLYKNVMLEEYIPDNNILTNCFLNGSYYYSNNSDIPPNIINDFIKLLLKSSKTKRNIIIKNLHTKFDSIERYEKEYDVPF